MVVKGPAPRRYDVAVHGRCLSFKSLTALIHFYRGEKPACAP